jgi:hypothetical protein
MLMSDEIRDDSIGNLIATCMVTSLPRPSIEEILRRRFDLLDLTDEGRQGSASGA